MVQFGCEPKNRGTQNGWFVSWKTLLNMDDLGVPLFLETPVSLFFCGRIPVF